jgi:hypothetical protein
MRLSFGDILEGKTPIFVEVSSQRKPNQRCVALILAYNRLSEKFSVSTPATKGEPRQVWLGTLLICRPVLTIVGIPQFQSYLQERYPTYEFEPGFAEEDPWWKPGQ